MISLESVSSQPAAPNNGNGPIQRDDDYRKRILQSKCNTISSKNRLICIISFCFFLQIKQNITMDNHIICISQ